jgi:hypothetical protein
MSSHISFGATMTFIAVRSTTGCILQTEGNCNQDQKAEAKKPPTVVTVPHLELDYEKFAKLVWL